jgi:hypothetical protein
MKYVVLRCEAKDTVVLMPIIFPAALVHKSVATAIAVNLRHDHGYTSVKALSAGDVRWCPRGAICSGKSETLGVASRPEEDGRLIDSYDYTHGIVS